MKYLLNLEGVKHFERAKCDFSPLFFLPSQSLGPQVESSGVGSATQIETFAQNRAGLAHVLLSPKRASE